MLFLVLMAVFFLIVGVVAFVMSWGMVLFSIFRKRQERRESRAVNRRVYIGMKRRAIPLRDVRTI